MAAVSASASSPILADPVPLTPQTASTGAASVSFRFRVAVRHLRVAAREHASSYDRDADFGDWVDQGRGCNTRAVVLERESLTADTENDNCTVETGRWRSYYNATIYTAAHQLQIDHLVPVKNVWVSGAWQWAQTTRVAYYNDLTDDRTLAAVDIHDNEAKGASSPDARLPPANHCRYVREYTSIKLRWRLSVTQAEQEAITDVAADCPNAEVRYTPADVATRGTLR
jgi:hypothetical protein